MNTTHKKNTTGLIRKWFTRGIACMALLFAGQSAHATTYTWANSNVAGDPAASLNWFNATQGAWTGGTPASGNSNTIQFFQDATTQLTNTGATQTQTSNIDYGSAFELGTLTLSGKGATTAGKDLTMTISGNALNFSAATGTINLDAANGSRTLTYNVNSAIQLGTASSASALTLTGNGNAVISIGGVISELQLGGGSLTKSGTSTVRLSGANTYTGTTTINGGTLFLGNAGASGSLSTSSAIVVNSGTFTIARNNAVTQGTDFSGTAITGAGGFTQSGGTTGITTLNAANTYTGVTTINSGVLAFSTAADGGLASNLGQSSSAAANLLIASGPSAATLKYTGTGGSTDRLFTLTSPTFAHILDASGTGAINFNNTGAIAYGTVNQVRTLQLNGSNTGNNTLAALIQDNGTGKVSINKDWNGGGGTWVITGTNTYTGSTSIGQGTVIVTSLKNIGTPSNLGAGGTIAFGLYNPAGTLKYLGTGDTTDRAIDFTSTGGSSTMVIDQSGTGLLKFTGTFTMSGASDGKTLKLQGSSAGTGEMQSILVDNSPANRLKVEKAGTGTWTLSGNNTYTGATTVPAGLLTLGNVNGLGFGGVQRTSTGASTVSAGATLDLNGRSNVNEPITLNGTGVGSNGALVNNSATAASIGNGIAGLAVAATGSGSGYSTAPTVVISGTGSGATAAASLGLTTASIATATGGTGWVTGDKVNITGGGGTGAIGTVTASAGVITSIAITTAGTGYTTAPTGMNKNTSTAGAGTLTLTGNATSFTVGGLAMTAAGTGYTGTPTFTFNGSAATVTPTLSSVTLATDSSVGGTGDITINAVVSGSKALTKVGAGTLTLTANNTYSGATLINAGTLVGVVGGSCSNSAVTVASARALGISITDINKKWTCASLALNSGSQLKFDFTVPTPHASEAPLNILGNLTFSETSTIVVSPRTTTPGKYPLLTVGGTVLTTSLPTLSPDGVNGRLVWEGKTLWVTIVPVGTMIRFF